MKKRLLKVLKQLRNDGHDLKEEPVLFTWRYEEAPEIKFKLLMQEVGEDEPDEHSVIH